MTAPPNAHDLQRIDGSALRFHIAGETEHPRALVLLLHGSGSHGGDLLPLARHLGPLLSGAQFVLADAPQSYREVLPPEGLAATEQQRPDIDWNQSRTWVDPRSTQPVAGGEARDALLAALDTPVRALSRLADLLLAKHQLPHTALAIYGFSQGGMMAAYLGLHRTEPCAAVVCHSGQFFGADTVRSRPRMLVMVGSLELAPDRIMSHVYPLTVRALRNLQVPVDELVCDGLLHGINPDAVQRCGAFLNEALATADVARPT